MATETASAFFVTGGTLRPDAPCYVERQADRDLFEALLNREFCYVLTSRQMGKSSLMVRAAVRLREQGVHVVVLDLSAIGQNVDAEQWHNGLLAGIGRQLRLELELEDYWDSHSRLTPMQRLISALREVALVRCAGPLVVFVDELDVVRSLPFKTDEFFAAIRSCSNRRAEDPEFQRLTFCLLGVATPSDLIQDPRITPFNIGRRIELNDFTPVEAAPLAKGLELAAGRPALAEAALRRILYWTDGHPYLTQRLGKAVATREGQDERSSVGRDATSTVDSICSELFLTERARERDDNLVFVRDRILRLEVDRAAVLHLYEQVLGRAGAPDEETDPLAGVLRLAGVVRRDGNRLRVRNRIYARAFDRLWIERNMPDAEKLRQREAYQRGVRRTALAASIVLVIMGGLVVLALWSSTRARSATWAALRDQARLSRLSGLAGQRFGAVDSIQQASRIKPSPELRDEAIACLGSPDLRKQPGRMRLESNAVAVAVSGDLKTCAFSTSNGEMVVREVDGRQPVQQSIRWQTGMGPAVRIWFAPDAHHLALAHTNNGLTVLSFWRSSPPARLFALTNQMQVDTLDFSADGGRLAIGGADRMIRIHELPGGRLLTEWEADPPPSLVCYHPNGSQLAVASVESLTIKICEPSSGKLIRTLHSASPPARLAWYPDGRLLAGAGHDRRIRIWEVEEDEFPKEELPVQPSDVTSLVFNHSGGLLASACADEAVRLWEPGTGRLLLTLSDSDSVSHLRFSPDDQQLGFAVAGGEISFWQVAPGEERRVLFDYDADELMAVDIHPDGRLLATADNNGITLWDLIHLRRLARMPIGTTSAVRFQPGSGDLITGEFRGNYCFQIERLAGEPSLRLKPKEEFYLGPGAKALDVATDADVVAVAYDDRIRMVRNTNSAYASLGELIGEPGFGSVAVSPDGRRIAAANWKRGELWVWDRSNDLKLVRWRVDGQAHLRFSPDGKLLATGTERTAALWDADTLQPVVRIERPHGAVRPTPVAFTRDGKTWAMALTDSRVRLLGLDGGTIADLESSQKQSLIGLSFSPDGSRLVCATASKLVLVWDLGAVTDGLNELGMAAGLNAPRGRHRSDTPLMGVEIGALDRLRHSQVKRVLGMRREIGDLTDLIRRNPTIWFYYQKRADKCRTLGEYETAIHDYQEWIRLDEASTNRSPKDRAWPFRDLAMVYLSGPDDLRDYEKALRLTEEALRWDPENGDNHYRRGLACYRLDHFDAAEASLESAKRALEREKKSVTVVLFYQAMCQARQKKSRVAAESLERARDNYAKTDLKYRESHAEELADLLWEAERVVKENDPGG